MKKDMVLNIKGIDMEINALQRRFNSTLPDVLSEEVMHENVINYIYEHNNVLSENLIKICGLENIDVNDIKVECWFWSKQVNSYCTIELDDYYGGAFQDYPYKLIVGGTNHGNLVANGYHENNTNDIDIIYRLGDLGYHNPIHTYIDTIHNMVQEYFDKWEPIERSNREKLDTFRKFIRNHRLELVTGIYKDLAINYSYILDYSQRGGELYSMLIKHSDILLNDLNRILNGIDVDSDYFKRCKELKIIITNVRNNIRYWYENVYIYVGKIAENNIGISDVSTKILDFV